MLGREEREQRCVDLARVRREKAVRTALDHDEPRAWDGRGRALSADLEWNDRIPIAVDDERGNGDLLQIGPEIRSTKG